MADSGLDLGIETALLLYFLHDLIHASPRVKSLHFKRFFSKMGFGRAAVDQNLMRRF
jgi:hypothetical protein